MKKAFTILALVCALFFGINTVTQAAPKGCDHCKVAAKDASACDGCATKAMSKCPNCKKADDFCSEKCKKASINKKCKACAVEAMCKICRTRATTKKCCKVTPKVCDNCAEAAAEHCKKCAEAKKPCSAKCAVKAFNMSCDECEVVVEKCKKCTKKEKK